MEGFLYPLRDSSLKILVGVYVIHKFIVLYFSNGPRAHRSPPSDIIPGPQKVTCYGCKHNLLNPEYHTDYGGCEFGGIEI